MSRFEQTPDHGKQLYSKYEFPVGQMALIGDIVIVYHRNKTEAYLGKVVGPQQFMTPPIVNVQNFEDDSINLVQLAQCVVLVNANDRHWKRNTTTAENNFYGLILANRHLLKVRFELSENLQHKPKLRYWGKQAKKIHRMLSDSFQYLFGRTCSNGKASSCFRIATLSNEEFKRSTWIKMASSDKWCLIIIIGQDPPSQQSANLDLVEGATGFSNPKRRILFSWSLVPSPHQLRMLYYLACTRVKTNQTSEILNIPIL